MPNHVINHLKFKDLTIDDQNFIIQLLTTLEETKLSKATKSATTRFDFNKIIPEPRTEDECPEDCLVTPDSHVMKDEQKPWFDWYAWHNKYWGTKWNAYETYTITGKDGLDDDSYYVEFEFQTAWSAPMLIINKLKLLGYHMEYKFADEDWGNNCGEGVFNPEDGEDWSFTYERDMEDPRRFALELWGYDYDEILEEEEGDSDGD